MKNNDQNQGMSPEMRAQMIVTISKAIQMMDDQTLQSVYILILHIQ